MSDTLSVRQWQERYRGGALRDRNGNGKVLSQVEPLANNRKPRGKGEVAW